MSLAKLVKAYAVDDWLLIVSFDLTMFGLFVGGDFAVERPLNAGAGALGEALLTAFEHCRDGVAPPPPDGGVWLPGFLERKRLRSWSEFYKRARSVTVRDDGAMLTFEATATRGRRLFLPIKSSLSIVAKDSDVVRLGDELIAAVDQSVPGKTRR